jgi:hypothetical protein
MTWDALVPWFASSQRLLGPYPLPSMTSAETNSLLSHFLLRLQKDITRIDNLIQAVYNGQSAHRIHSSRP